jgi:hypothetical protein
MRREERRGFMAVRFDAGGRVPRTEEGCRKDLARAEAYSGW